MSRPAGSESRRAGRARRASWLAFSLALAALGAGYLVGPRVPAGREGANCVGNVDLPGPFGLGLNCDAPVFMSLARAPEGLLRSDCSRQSRPGLVLLAIPLARVFERFADPGRPVARFGHRWNPHPPYISESFEVDFSSFLAYSILNVGFLLLVFAAWRGIARPWLRPDGPTTLIALAVGVLLVANDVSKAFYWAPHTQLLNILGPVFAVYAARRVHEGGLLSPPVATFLGVTMGYAMITYGVFAIAVPAMGLAALAAIARARVARFEVAGRTLFGLGAVLALTALPPMLWYRYVVAETGQFFNMELSMGHVVWMADAWREGPAHFWEAWSEKLEELVEMARPQARPALALALVVLVSAFEAGALRPTWRRARATVGTCLVVSLLGGAFYASVGFVIDRLAFAMVPSLVVAAGVLALSLVPSLDPRRRWALAFASAALAVGTAVYSVVKDGPYS